MKKVRYAISAAGAIPALAAMAAPAAAAPQAPAAAPSTKTVSLHHTAAGYCTGSQEATGSVRSVHIAFWHTFSPTYDTSCIGTVEAAFSRDMDQSSYARYRIWDYSLGGTHKMAYSHHSKGSTFGTFHFADGVHRAFGYVPVQVCVAGVNYSGRVFQGPACRSVG
jgi:hypothetical protein